jgi:hypothetical protein
MQFIEFFLVRGLLLFLSNAFAEVQCFGWAGRQDACPSINHFFHAA